MSHNLMKTCVCKSRYLRNVFHTEFRLVSTKPVVKEEKQQMKEESALKEYENLSNVYRKTRVKLPQKPPFAKNCFLGIFDTDMLAFPEVLEKDELKKLDSVVEPVSYQFQENDNISLQDAANMKILGLSAPQLSGGREYNVTESARLLDVISTHHSNVNLLFNERLGVDALLKLCNDKQIKKYLDYLITGKSTSAFCVSEAGCVDPDLYKTQAVFNADKNVWVLDGEKSWVINGNTADLFTVVAKTEFLDRLGLKKTKNSLFLVERTFGGVSSKPLDNIGLEESDIATVTFNGTHIPAENLVGEVHKGDELLVKLLNELRLSSGISASTITKMTINEFVKFVKSISNDKNEIASSDFIYKSLSEMATSFYAMESMNYLTAALMDRYENQDCDLEATIVKTFCAEHTYNATKTCLNFIGATAYEKSNIFNKLHRDALGYTVLNDSLDSLKIMIALQGLHHAGVTMQQEITELRNPLYFGGKIFKKMWSARRQVDDNPKLTLNLGYHLHPSVTITAQMLEYCVLRLQFATETILSRYGNEVMSKHMDLNRIADCIMDIYAMAACLSRASRSYCIGLQHSDYEVVLANAFCIDAMQRVKTKVNEIYSGPYNTNDGNFINIGRKVMECGGYYAEHPLTKNF